MADRNHTAARRTFLHHGWMTRSDPTTKFVESPGRADYLIAGRGMAIAIEVKSGLDGWSPGELRENQREWAEKYCIPPPFSTPYWIYLTIGVDPEAYVEGKARKTPHASKPSVYMPRRTWLFPYVMIHRIERALEGIQSTLPYRARKGLSTEIQRIGLDAHSLLRGYELCWHKPRSVARPSWFSEAGKPYSYGLWLIPDGHPFSQMYMKATATA